MTLWSCVFTLPSSSHDFCILICASNTDILLIITWYFHQFEAESMNPFCMFKLQQSILLYHQFSVGWACLSHCTIVKRLWDLWWKGTIWIIRLYALWLFNARQNLLLTTKYIFPETATSPISFAVYSTKHEHDRKWQASLAWPFSSMHGSKVCPLWENKTSSPLRISEQQGFLKWTGYVYYR